MDIPPEIDWQRCKEEAIGKMMTIALIDEYWRSRSVVLSSNIGMSEWFTFRYGQQQSEIRRKAE